jgi:alanine dehydrogenase
MKVGVVSERKAGERRVALTPAGAAALVRSGHQVVVQVGAGTGSGFPDDGYAGAGAELSDDAATIWAESDLLLKVKEPLPDEHGLLHADLTLFTYLHLAADRALTEALLAAGTTAIAYETVEDSRGGLPLLVPMSEIAGRLAALAAAHHLQQPFGGPGILVCGAPGVRPARVLIVGGGVVGSEAAAVARGMGAEVVILERSVEQIRRLELRFGSAVRALFSDEASILAEAHAADVVIGAVLLPGALAPKLLGHAQLAELRSGALLIDVAIDQGGCFETSHPTTYAEPTFCTEGIVHYCVANMPGAVPATATRALAQATLPFVLELADAGVVTPALQTGLNVMSGRIEHTGVAGAFPDLPGTVAARAA